MRNITCSLKHVMAHVDYLNVSSMVCNSFNIFPHFWKIILITLYCLHSYTAKEGLVRIQYKRLVPMYVFPKMKLLFPKQNYNVLSPSFQIYVSVSDLYIPTIGGLFCYRQICGPILGIHKSRTGT